MSKALPTIHTAPEELRDWLEKLVKELQFARLVSAVMRRNGNREKLATTQSNVESAVKP